MSKKVVYAGPKYLAPNGQILPMVVMVVSPPEGLHANACNMQYATVCNMQYATCNMQTCMQIYRLKILITLIRYSPIMMVGPPEGLHATIHHADICDPFTQSAGSLFFCCCDRGLRFCDWRPNLSIMKGSLSQSASVPSRSPCKPRPVQLLVFGPSRGFS